MSNKRNLSQQSIDRVLKLNINLRNELLEHFESFNSSKNDQLLIKLKKLLDFKRIKNQESNDYFEINLDQIYKTIDFLYKLEGFYKFKNPSNNLKQKLDKIKDEIIEELIMLPIKLCKEINKDINSNNDQFYVNENNELTNDEEKNKLINLPILVLEIVFKYLSIDDLLTCRLVNKKFKEFSDHTNGINKLIIGQPNGDYYRHCDYYWYYNYKLIENQDIISLKCFRTIQKLSIFNLNTNLKYLKIHDLQFKLEEISNSINLESIEFGFYYFKADQQILNLNNLKVFISNGRSVQLNTPKLKIIQFDDIDNIKLNSESIKHLITYDYDNKLEIFKNLEIMELRDINRPANENLLSKFKNLKQLKISLGNYYRLDYSFAEMKNSLIKILNDKIKLKRSIDIYLEGIKIENIDKFNEFVSNEHVDWKFRLNNYDLLDLNLSSINYLRYDELEVNFNNIKNDLPSSFFDKFLNIHRVYVYSVKDIDGLNWFLNKLKYTIGLQINVSLDEAFYNNLPNTIRSLHIYNREDINYEFILKLPELIELSCWINKDLFDLVFTAFLNLRYLNIFIFYYNNKRITIEKNDKYFYLNKRRNKLDYNQLIEECNKIRSNEIIVLF